MPLDKERKFYRVVRSQPPAMITFSYVDRPELVEDFLKPPPDGPHGGTARFRYRDRSGANRVFDWALEGQEGKSIVLPDSDLTVKLEKATEIPTDTPETASLNQYLGDDPVPIASSRSSSGTNEPVLHMVLGNCADGAQRDSDGQSRRAARPGCRWRRSITWSRRRSTPRPTGVSARSTCSPVPTMRFTIAFSAEAKEGGKGELRASGPLEKGKPVVAFGGGAQHAHDDHVSGRQLLARRDREEHLRAGRASQGPDGQRNPGAAAPR